MLIPYPQCQFKNVTSLLKRRFRCRTRGPVASAAASSDLLSIFHDVHQLTLNCLGMLGKHTAVIMPVEALPSSAYTKLLRATDSASDT